MSKICVLYTKKLTLNTYVLFHYMWFCGSNSRGYLTFNISEYDLYYVYTYQLILNKKDSMAPGYYVTHNACFKTDYHALT